MSEPTYWVRLGTRTEGPLSLSEVRLRAARGALSRVHMVSRDRTRWVVAAKVSEIFRSNGSVCTDVLALAPVEDALSIDFPDDGAENGMFQVSLPGMAMVRAQWILVPAWTVIAVAALLPTARQSAEALRAWDLVQLSEFFGWRGVLLGSLWLLMLLIAAIAIGIGTLARGNARAVGGLVVGVLAVATCTVTVWAGTASGFIAGTTLLLAVFAVRVVDAILYGPCSQPAGAREPALTLTETAVGFSLAVTTMLVAIVAVVIKGVPFSVAAFFALVASALCAVAAVLAGGESPKRTLILWLSLGTIIAVVLALLAESITAHLLGAPRMALFEAVRAICVTALTSLCAYVSYCELRYVQHPTPPAPDMNALNSEDIAL
ncbi:MAG: hypothetical protein EXS17_07300 [Phycisphaerales bacterium]|nr:hypothetical protein [Phycisphaerales bacterium]